MSDNNKYNAPSGPPPNYPQQAYTGTGNPGPGSPSPYGDQNLNQVAAYNTGYVQPQGQGYGPPGGYYQQGFQQGPYEQGYPPGGPGYGPPQGGMYYQQQPMGYQQRGGYGSSAGEGVCAGLLGLCACCCCLDLLF